MPVWSMFKIVWIAGCGHSFMWHRVQGWHTARGLAFVSKWRHESHFTVFLLGTAIFFFQPSSIYPWLNFGLPPHCPQVVWCLWGEIEPFSAKQAQDGLAECDQPEKNLLKYSAVAGNWTRATGGRTDSEIHLFTHWAIVTDCHYVQWISLWV